MIALLYCIYRHDAICIYILCILRLYYHTYIYIHIGRLLEPFYGPLKKIRRPHTVTTRVIKLGGPWTRKKCVDGDGRSRFMRLCVWTKYIYVHTITIKYKLYIIIFIYMYIISQVYVYQCHTVVVVFVVVITILWYGHRTM